MKLKQCPPWMFAEVPSEASGLVSTFLISTLDTVGCSTALTCGGAESISGLVTERVLRLTNRRASASILLSWIMLDDDGSRGRVSPKFLGGASTETELLAARSISLRAPKDRSTI
ncbi:uncharacterized protein G2W53_007097 [Senna tora]|uniref:Uncharacterized protein n=1 Tax=Senna tora TaxID=362788 RepID=A0A834X659_9FABA|nr:uncharacterized protein G2W53_007097 [Senna tora]